MDTIVEEEEEEGTTTTKYLTHPYLFVSLTTMLFLRICYAQRKIRALRW